MASVAARFVPSSLVPVLDQVRRDLLMVREGLAGRSPPPLVSRQGRTQGSSGAPGSFQRGEGLQPPLCSRSPVGDPSGPQPVAVLLGGVSYRVTAVPGATVLEAGLAAGLPLPYSCTVGGCGTCKVTLLSGEVRMQEPNCLTPDERARGQVLACMARPVSPVAVEVPH